MYRRKQLTNICIRAPNNQKNQNDFISVLDTLTPIDVSRLGCAINIIKNLANSAADRYKDLTECTVKVKERKKMLKLSIK